MAGEKLMTIIQQTSKSVMKSSESTDLIMGRVTSSAPLRIKIEDKFELASQYFILSPFCYTTTRTFTVTTNQPSQVVSTTDSVVTIPELEVVIDPATEPTGKTLEATVTVPGQSITIPAQTLVSEPETVTLWRGLQTGDTVRLLRISGGQKYYVLDRGNVGGDA